MVPTSETGHPLIFVNIKNVVEQFCFKLAEISRITIYWHEVDKYSGVARAQVQREEMISGLEDMVY